MEKHILLIIHVTDRLKHAPEMQTVLTEFGCCIKTRLGLHDTSKDFCSPNGLIVLEMSGDEEKAASLESKLLRVEGIEVEKVVFDH